MTPAYLTIIDAVSGTRDNGAGMWVLQTGASISLSESASLTISPTYYAFHNLQGTPGPDVAVPSNSRDVDGDLIYGYDGLTLGASLAFTDVGALPSLELFAEYVRAFDPNDDNTGYLAGVTLGDVDVGQWGAWQLSYNYRRLDRDAWPDFLPDSDFLFGATNAKGSEIELAWGVAHNVWLSVDYYANAQYISTDIEQDMVQLDLNLRW